MKKILVTSIVSMLSTLSQAHTYHCQVTIDNKTKPVASFNFNTLTEHNKFIQISDKFYVGCVALKSPTPLVTCGFDFDMDKTSINSTVEEGSRVLALNVKSNLSGTNLICTRQL